MDIREKLEDDVHSKLMGLLQRAPYIRCEDVHRQYAVNWLMNNGVTVQEQDGCEYCNDGKTIETDIDGEIEIVKIIPLPAIDLVTGEQERKAASPYWAMRLLLDGGEDFVRIHFCPLCGRRLPQPPKGE